ncbi:MAG: PD40 domain-containing protein [Ignavibacteriae bacterium]|nr:PD40 domain-containing protein [Ignavibacteriota bacterium]
MSYVLYGDYSDKRPLISPSWAPDGSIFVQGWTSMNNGIYKVAADFSEYERIDPDLTNVSEPSVSPDGKMIVFISDEKLWTMGIDGSNPTLLNTTATKLHMPVWSPDSKYIAVTSYGHIHIIDPNLLTHMEITQSHYVGTDNQLCWVK